MKKPRAALISPITNSSKFPFLSYVPIFFVLFSLSLSQAKADITGIVFRDFDADGVQTVSASVYEAGIGGIVVTAYDAAGAQVVQDFTYGFNCTGVGAPDASCLGAGSPAAGSYSLPVGAAGPFRVEFTLPPDGSLDFLNASATGGSSVEFASDTETVDVGFASIGQYCQPDPNIVTSCFQKNLALGNTTDVLVQVPFSASGRDPSLKTTLSIADMSALIPGYTVGSVWGVAYNPYTNKVYTSAGLRTLSEVGSEGLGAIHETDLALPPPNSALWVTVPNAGTVTQTLTNTVPGDRDPDAYAKVGKVGIGDIDINAAGTKLYAMNLNDRTLYEYNLADGTQAGAYLVPDPGCSDPDDVRPWATKVHDGKVYVGVVCSEEAAGGTDAGLEAHVMELSAAGTFNTIVTVPLNYTRDFSRYETSGITCPLSNSAWHRWDSDINTFSDPSKICQSFPIGADTLFEQSYQTPIFTDIEFDTDGSLILAFTDRFSMQAPYNDFSPNVADGNDFFYHFPAGDLLRVCNAGSTYIVEGNPGCAFNGGTDGVLEYYNGDETLLAGIPLHGEDLSGGIAINFNTGEVISTAMDPLDDPGASLNVDTAGLRWLSNATGGLSDTYEIVAQGDDIFDKALTLGDVELLCSPPPIEIGNFIWNDINGDGIQDPGEAALAGVSVDLVHDTTGDMIPDTVIATVVTDANGRYLFSSDATRAGSSTVNFEYGVAGLAPSFDADGNGSYNDALLGDIKNTYGVRVTGFAGQAPLAGLAPTTNDATGDTTNGSLVDIRDSDGVVSGPDALIIFEAGGAGENNHTFDFGFSSPLGSISDTVWLDTNGNGVIDTGELGISGVTVILVDPGPDGLFGTTDDIQTTQVTDGSGNYIFSNLPYGTYQVSVDASTLPSGLSPTFDFDGGGDSLSVTTITSSVPDDIDQDFGFNGSNLGSISDLVWMDNNGNGAFDVGEMGLAGVTVVATYFGADGLFGTFDDTQTSTVTAADGTYSFGGLPFGTYAVVVDVTTLPAGKVATYDADGGGDSASIVMISATAPNNIDQDFGFNGGGGLATVAWNGFCDQQNFVSLTNTCTTPVDLSLSLIGSLGNLLSSDFITVQAGQQIDYSVNDMFGFSQFDFGIVELASSPAGCLTGSMGLFAPIGSGQYFTIPIKDKSLGGVSELFALSDGSVSNACYATFNTFQPSMNPEDASLVTTHWLQMQNLTGEEKQAYTVNRYDSTGSVISSEEVSLAPKGRQDIAAGHEDETTNRYGIVEVIPQTSGSDYSAQLFRYGVDTGTVAGERMSAFSLADNCSTGKSGIQYLTVSRGAGANNWLEIYNINNSEVEVNIEVYSNTAGLVKTYTKPMTAFESWHFSAEEGLLPGESGVAKVITNDETRILAKSTSYIYREDSRILASDTEEGRSPLGLTGTGSYNGFRNQLNWLRLHNTSSEPVTIQVMGYEQVENEMLGSDTIILSANSGRDVSLNTILNFSSTEVGRVKLEMNRAGAVVADIIRVQHDSTYSVLEDIETFAVK